LNSSGKKSFQVEECIEFIKNDTNYKEEFIAQWLAGECIIKLYAWNLDSLHKLKKYNNEYNEICKALERAKKTV